MARDTMETPFRKVMGPGPAHTGTMHFWRQRLTALANLPLAIAFVILIVSLAGKPWREVVPVLASPGVAIVLVLLIISVATHMRIGMQVIIEDYVHGEGVRIASIIANTFYACLVAALSIFAILKIAFGFGI